MWAIGVIIYITLGGYAPFRDDNYASMNQNILSGRFRFHKKYWEHVSDEAKDLIQHLLTVDPVQRFTVHQAMSHPWVRLLLPVS